MKTPEQWTQHFLKKMNPESKFEGWLTEWIREIQLDAKSSSSQMMTPKIIEAIKNTVVKCGKVSMLPDSVIFDALLGNAVAMLKDGRNEDFVINTTLNSDVHKM